MCQSLANHPALERLDITNNNWRLSNAAKTLRTQALADMLKVNSLIREINVPSVDRFQSIWSTKIEPKLRLNSYTPKIIAVTKAPSECRAALLGRAMSKVSYGNSLLYLFLVGNKDLVVGRSMRRRTRRRLR